MFRERHETVHGLSADPCAQAFGQVQDRMGGQRLPTCFESESSAPGLQGLSRAALQAYGDDRFGKPHTFEAQAQQIEPACRRTVRLRTTERQDRRIGTQVIEAEVQALHTELAHEQETLQALQQCVTDAQQQLPVRLLLQELLIGNKDFRCTPAGSRIRQAPECTIEIEQTARAKTPDEALARQPQAITDLGDADTGERLDDRRRPVQAVERHGAQCGRQVGRRAHAATPAVSREPSRGERCRRDREGRGEPELPQPVRYLLAEAPQAPEQTQAAGDFHEQHIRCRQRDEGGKAFEPGGQALEHLLLAQPAAFLEHEFRQQRQCGVRSQTRHHTSRSRRRIDEQDAMHALPLLDDSQRLARSAHGLERELRQVHAKPELPAGRDRLRRSMRRRRRIERQEHLAVGRGRVG